MHSAPKNKPAWNGWKPFRKMQAKIVMTGYIVLFFTNIAFADSMLWEVRSETATVYLLGSIHMAKPDLYPLNVEIEKFFDKSSFLVLEINVLEVDQTALLQKIMIEGMYSGTKTLRDDISPEVYAMLQAHLNKSSLPTAALMKLKPGILAMTLESLEYIRMGFSPEQGIDMYFALRAEESKPILELESIEEQMNLILNIPDASSLLKYTLLGISSYGEQLDAITEAWKEGDSEKLDTLLVKENFDKYPELASVKDEMIYKRNISMAGKIKGYLATDQTYFVVVGAGHLIGNRSILSHLEEAGYPIRKF